MSHTLQQFSILVKSNLLIFKKTAVFSQLVMIVTSAIHNYFQLTSSVVIRAI
jgi:hypothetical protein